jgi:enterochelin esterase-like enzyme
MRRILALAGLAALTLIATAVQAQDDYQLGPDSQPQPGVPQGEVAHYTHKSEVFPGTVRDYWVYVPKQYDPNRAACVMVFQDGGGFQGREGQFRVPVVFDNLIHRGEMPVTIAIMINPGVAPAPSESAQPRFNRSFEYDSLGDRYTRFLTDEILPEVGKKLNLTKDPNGRAICGSSSGGIAAFTAAWERPDVFRRVVSFIGSFTNLHGGHMLPSLIRKTEPKPLRIFLQSGSNDQDIYSGSWPIGNTDIAAAFKYAGYDHKHVVGTGGHTGRHGGSILPDALRWIWRDYPTAPVTAERTPQPIMEVLPARSEWKTLHPTVEPRLLAVDGEGRPYVVAEDAILRVREDGKADIVRSRLDGIGSIAFGPDGQLYVTIPGRARILAIDPKGQERQVMGGIAAGQIAINQKGGLYCTDVRDGTIWLITADGKRRPSGGKMAGATGLRFSTDQSQLYVSHAGPGVSAWSYQVQPNGTLTAGQPYIEVHLPYGETATGAAGMTTDDQGRIYVASTLGVQLCDQPGRVNGIAQNPGREPVTAVAFGGNDMSTLYAVAGGKLYSRPTKTKGVHSFRDPIKPPNPRL